MKLIDYWTLWSKMTVTDTEAANYCAVVILKYWSRYKAVGDWVEIPPYVVGCIHYRESAFNFESHLANGDPLFDISGNPLATTHVPEALGPFNSWEEGAIAALENRHYGVGWKWDLANALQNLELWNGLGYADKGMNSPYLWSGTNQYRAGLFVADGKYDPNVVCKQAGCAAILSALKGHGVDLNEVAPVSGPPQGPAIP